MTASRVEGGRDVFGMTGVGLLFLITLRPVMVVSLVKSLADDNFFQLPAITFAINEVHSLKLP